MKHLILFGIMWLCGLMTVVAQNVPQVIPALQQWKPAKGKMVLSESGKVIISSDEEGALKQSAEILVQDLKEMFGWNYRVVIGKQEKGAVFLTLSKPDKTLGLLNKVPALARMPVDFSPVVVLMIISLLRMIL